MNREQLEIRDKLAALIGATPGWPPDPKDLADAVMPYVVELIDHARATWAAVWGEEIAPMLTDIIAVHPTVTGMRVPRELGEHLAPHVAELIERARRDERQVCVDLAARMAHDAQSARRYQRSAAMARVALALKNGVSQ